MEESNTPRALTWGQIIKECRTICTLKQEELAFRVGVDVKTVRNWEYGKVTDMRKVNRENLCKELQIPPLLLSLPRHLTVEETLPLAGQIRKFLEQGAYVTAWEASNLLLTECKNSRDKSIHLQLPHAYYMHGLATATLKDATDDALSLHKNMERAAQEQGDKAGVWISRTYQGEMYRRLGEYDEAQSYLEGVIAQRKAIANSGMESLIIGNCYQLLSRIYLIQEKTELALNALDEAEERAYAALSEDDHGWYMCFCLCAVKQERAKTLMVLHKYGTSFKVIDEAKDLAQSAGPRWQIPIALTRGETLMRYGRRHDSLKHFKEGVDSLTEGKMLAIRHNHFRQQKRIERLVSKWKEKELHKLEAYQELLSTS